MVSTIDTRPGIEVLRDLDAAQVLAYAAAQRRAADRAEARLLAAVVHWVDLHPVTGEHPAATGEHRDPVFAALHITAAPGSEGGSEGDSLGGPGTPGVARYAVEELAATLGLSYPAGLALVGEAVELVVRLPRLWGLVQDGTVPAWRARKVAELTTGLSRESVEFVDRHLAVAARHRMPGLGQLRSLIHEARLHCDPDQADAIEDSALARRGVWFDHRASTATTDLTARLDTPDALDLQQTVADLAARMGRLGDHRPLEIRRATALGLLAHPQRALDLAGHPTTDPTATNTTTGADRTAGALVAAGNLQGDAAAAAGTTGVAGAASPDSSLASPRAAAGGAAAGGAAGGCLGCGSRGLLYLHITAADLATHPATGRGGGTVERLGTTTLTLLRSWLQRLDHLTIRPVLDPHRTDPVDTHDPPGWMREHVQLRDRTCVFPSCPIDARTCDLDHIEPYLDPDTGGPPGQTNPDNLACLCRRHHRLKTFTAWTYVRDPDGSYTWTSPHGRTHTNRPGP
jgi:hypothetical protein